MINPNTLKPFGKFCVTLGMIPSSYKASLTYEEQLLWFCNYLENKVIPAINNNAEALEEVQALYEEIRQFVVDYFAHLDVQDEIDNKLDEMAKAGELQEIITSYLEIQGLLCFNTLNDLKEADNLIDGSFVKTLGTSAFNDGIGYIYKVRLRAQSDTPDNIQLIALNNYENLIAERISNALTSDKSNPIFYGADPTGNIDSSSAINKCIQANKGSTINFSQGTYLVNQSINLPYLDNEKVNINGNGAKIINNSDLVHLFFVGFDKNLNPNNDVGFSSYVKDLFIDGSNSNTTYCFDIENGFKDFKILNCKLFRFINGIRIGTLNTTPADTLISNTLIYGKGSEFEGVGILCNSTDSNINMCRIYGFRKCFVINGATTIRECHGLLRWAMQTSSNFDPYPRNESEFNYYYPLTAFAEINAFTRLFNCYSDSLYKTLIINTIQAVICTGMNIYNARSNVNNMAIHITVNEPKFIFVNSSINLGVHTSCECIHCDNTLTSLAQITIKNVTITNIARLTNPADLILSTQRNLISNKQIVADTWYLVSVIANNSDTNIIKGKLFINGFDYSIRMVGGSNASISSIGQLNKGEGLSRWSIGTVTIDKNVYVCIKSSSDLDFSKFMFTTEYASNLVFDVTPVKNNNVFNSTRVLSDYTNLVPNNELNLNNVA